MTRRHLWKWYKWKSYDQVIILEPKEKYREAGFPLGLTDGI